MEFPRRPAGRRGLSGSWNSDPLMVDGYRPDGVPWPVELRRYAYMTPLGGFSPDLRGGRIGVNRQALEENTALKAGDEVTVSVFEHGRPVPLVVRPTFEVVALDFGTPDAYLHSVEGEAVLSEDDADRSMPGLEALSAGIQVVLNGVLAVRARRADEDG